MVDGWHDWCQDTCEEDLPIFEYVCWILLMLLVVESEDEPSSLGLGGWWGSAILLVFNSWERFDQERVIGAAEYGGGGVLFLGWFSIVLKILLLLPFS